MDNGQWTHQHKKLAADSGDKTVPSGNLMGDGGSPDDLPVMSAPFTEPSPIFVFSCIKKFGNSCPISFLSP
jgi:hypothetical protein